MTDTDNTTTDYRPEVLAAPVGFKASDYDFAADLDEKQKRRKDNDKEIEKLRAKRSEINFRIGILLDQNAILDSVMAPLKRRVEWEKGAKK